MSSPVTLAARTPYAALLPEGETMLDPKWFVMAAALAALALLFSYDLTFGIAGSVIVGSIALIWLALRLWLAPERGEPASERGALVERFRRLSRNRRAAHAKELGAKRAPRN